MKIEEINRFIPKNQIIKLSKETTKPTYYHFEKIIDHKIKKLKEVFGGDAVILFAIKSNNHETIINKMAKSVDGFDIASVGELELIKNHKSNYVFFSGPGKTQDDIKLALNQDKKIIFNVESEQELSNIEIVAKKLNISAEISLRLNLQIKSIKSGFKMGSKGQFGMDLETINRILSNKNNYPNCNICSFHNHYGSQILDHESVINVYTSTINEVKKLSKKYNLEVKYINLGGGLGVTYFESQNNLDLKKLKSSWKALIESENNFLKNIQLFIEPGRFLVAESGIFITKVIYTKKIRENNFAIVNSGMHHNYVLAGGMGQIIRRNFMYEIIPYSLKETPKIKYNICGVLCTPQDTLLTNVEEKINPEDRIIFYNTGAYGLSSSPINFLSHPIAEIKFINN